MFPVIRPLVRRPRFARGAPSLVLAAGLSLLLSTAPVAAATTYNFAAYLGGPLHSSFTADSQITPANAGHLVQAWSWAPASGTASGEPQGGIYSSPAVYNHVIYIGANTGYFYALKESTGTVIWKKLLGWQPQITCPAQGIVTTATVSTVKTSTHTTETVVYVSSPDGYLYALNAANGATIWRSTIAIPSTTTNDYFDWSSPTVFGNYLYVGIASNCDTPLVRGGLVLFNRTTGARLASYYTVPAGSVGGSIWSSAAVNSAEVFVTTGNAPAGTTGDSDALVRLNPTTLARVAGWSVPDPTASVDDFDFGASPTFFKATINGVVNQLIGACSKDGTYYAFLAGSLAKPYWQYQVGTPNSDGGSACLAASIFDSSGRLFVAGNQTTINGMTYYGSIREMNPATGQPIWQDGLSANVLGTPSEDGAGVIAAATHEYIPSGLTNQAYLINAANGQILAIINNANAKEFAQPVFADKYLLLTTINRLYAYMP